MVWIEGLAASQADAKSVRRLPDLEGAAGLPASIAGGGAGTTSGSGVVGSGAVVIAATGLLWPRAPQRGLWARRGASPDAEVWDDRPREERPPRPREKRALHSPHRSERPAEPSDRQGRGEERDALGGGRAARKARGREEEGLKVGTFTSHARKVGESMDCRKRSDASAH